MDTRAKSQRGAFSLSTRRFGVFALIGGNAPFLF
jgi:hypothetical protein